MTQTNGTVPSPTFAHTVISASAGSGKTYQLSTRAIALLIAGAPVDSVLATTFSRKAAGEIRDRILGRIARAAVSPDEFEALAKAMSETQGTPATNLTAVHRLLARLLDSILLLRVGTIDSMFAQIVSRSSAGVLRAKAPADAHELEGIAHDAVVRMFRDALQHPTDATELFEAVKGILAGRLSRSIVPAIATELKDLLPIYRSAAESAWQWPSDAAFPTRVDIDSVRERIEAAIGQMHGSSDRRVAGVAQKTHDHYTKKMEQSLRRAAADPADFVNWRSLSGSTLLKNVAAATQNSPARYFSAVLPDALTQPLGELDAMMKCALERIYIERTRSTRILLERYDAAYRSVLRERGLTTFDSVARDAEAVVADWIASNASASGKAKQPNPFGATTHLLLDEFQDTSLLQWDALRPLATTLVCQPPSVGNGAGAMGASFFCVGDVKQSIYGWRGGEPSLLRELKHRFADGEDFSRHFERRTLATTYRSHRAIVECVNALFTDIASNPAVVQFDRVAAATSWRKSFAPHESAQHLRALPEGEVRLTLTRTLKGGAAIQNELIKAIIASARKLVDARAGRIAVIVASNAFVGRIVQALREAGLDAAGRGGGSLEDSTAANAVLDALRFAHASQDLPALFNVVSSPLGALLRLPITLLPTRARSHAREEASIALCREILEAGVARWIDTVRVRLDAQDLLSQRDRLRLTQLAALVEQLEASTGPRGARSLGELAFAASTSRVNDESVAGSQAAIEVVNFHQSKGLEWDAVIVSELSGKLSRPNTIGVERGSTGRPSRVLRGLPESLKLGPAYDSVMEETRRANFEERLSMLYVGATRAKSYLEFVMARPVGAPKSKTVDGLYYKALASVVYSALAPDLDASTTECVTRSLFGKPLASGSSFIERAASDAALAPTVLRVVCPPSRGGRTRKATAAYALTEQDDPAEDRGPEYMRAGFDARHRGVVAHEVLGSIEWLRESSSFALEVDARAQITERLGRILPERDSNWLETEIASVETLVAGWTELRTFLAIPAAIEGSTSVALRERAFVHVGRGSALGALRTGSIDRLVLHGKLGAWTSAEVIDYKTDRISAEEVVAQGEHHRLQLEAYRDIVEQQYPSVRGAVRLTLIFLHPRVIHSLPAAALKGATSPAHG